MQLKKVLSKKVAADQFKNVRRNGLIALSLKGDDLLLDVRLLSEDDDIIMSSRNGQSVRFKNADIRPMGRGAAGVKGMALKKGDTLVSVDVITPVAAEMHMLVVTDNGFGKRTQLSEYKVQNRGGSGIKTAQLTAKTGLLVGARVVDASYTEVIVISKKGQVIRTALEDISVLGRATQGVRIMKLRAGDEIASLTLL